MLGAPDCPPRKVTDREVTDPSSVVLCRVQRQVPDSSEVGTPTVKCISTRRMDELSLNVACASRRSPSRVPPSENRVKRDRSSFPVTSSTGWRFGAPHAAISSTAQSKGTRAPPCPEPRFFERSNIVAL